MIGATARPAAGPRRAARMPAAGLVPLLLPLLLLPAGCDDKPDGLDLPLAQWRSSSAAARLLATGQGITLRVPDVAALHCLSTSPPEAMAICDFTLDERNGRLVAGDPGAVPLPARLRVTMLFLPGVYATHRLLAGPTLEEAPPGSLPPGAGPDGAAPVLQGALEGLAQGRRFAIGCWARPPGAPLGPFACSLAVEGGLIGSSLVDFSAMPPGEAALAGAAANPDPVAAQAGLLDRKRVDRLVALVAAIDTAFSP